MNAFSSRKHDPGLIDRACETNSGRKFGATVRGCLIDRIRGALVPRVRDCGIVPRE